MSQYRRILVPFDFSAEASRSLRYGCALARQHRAELYLLHVVQDLAPIGVGSGGITAGSAAKYVFEIEQSASDALSQVPSRSWTEGLTVLRQTMIGSPGERIVEFAKSNDIDLICVGTHGRTGLKRFFLGSVAERVVQHAHCKVLVVRTRERDFVTSEHAWPALRRILVPIDFSEQSRSALEEAAGIASPFGAELHLLHVVENNNASVSEIALAYPIFQSYIHELVKTAETQMADLRLPESIVQPLQRKVVVGEAIDRINDYAAEHDIDLIVMGTHGRTGPSHWLLGSVCERVVRSAPCPVLATRPGPPAGERLQTSDRQLAHTP